MILTTVPPNTRDSMNVGQLLKISREVVHLSLEV
jgi:hypothetical protein